jgi:ATP-dependent Clp protease adaptor protein ClpS
MNYKEIEETSLKELLTEVRELVLHNDDFNTFDHVTDCLIAICGHEEMQAEQCTYIVHYKGKCTVKRDVVEKLEPMLIALQQQNLTAEIR